MTALSDLPTPPGRLPFVGHAMQLDVEKLHHTLEDWAAEYGSFRLGMGARTAMVLADPAQIREVLKDRPTRFRRQRHLAETIEEMSIRGVFTAEGETWKVQRRVAMRTLGQHTLEGFSPLLRRITGDLLARWRRTEGHPTDVLADATCFTVDVLTELAFAEPAGSLSDTRSRLLQLIDPIFPKLGQRLFAIVPYWRWVRLSSDRELDRVIDEVRAYVSAIIASARASAGPDAPANFLTAMLRAGEDSFDDEAIFGNAVTMLFAGEDTTATTLAWSLHLLADRPDVLAQLAEEVDRRFDGADVAPSLEATQIPLLDAILNEALRLKPVGPILFMEPLEDTTVGEVAVPKGTTLVVLTRFGALDENRFANPRSFDPSHWDDPGRAAELQREGVFVPFGSGPRICPGRALALAELRLALSMVARCFTLEREGPASAVEEVNGFTMAPRGLTLRFHPRT